MIIADVEVVLNQWTTIAKTTVVVEFFALLLVFAPVISQSVDRVVQQFLQRE